MSAAVERMRVAIIGPGRISDLHAIEYVKSPYTQHRRGLQARHGGRPGAGTLVGHRAGEGVRRLARLPGRRFDRRLRGAPAPPHAHGGGAGGHRDGQAPLDPEAGGLHGGRVLALRRGSRRGRGAGPGSARLRELPLLPAGRAARGAGATGRARGGAVSAPDQPLGQPGLWLGCPRPCGRVALRHRAERRWAAGIR